MSMWLRRSRTLATALAATLSVVLLAGTAGCAPGDSGQARRDGTITVWSLENLPARMAATRKVVHRFEQRSDVDVKLVGVDESQLPQLIMSAAAAGNLPDVIGGVPLSQAWQMYDNDLLDTEAAGKVVSKLGADTYNANALRLASDDGHPLVVPSDAWLQLLAYRKDLFKKAGLHRPDTYARMLTAARTLDRGKSDGIAAANDPGDVFTQQSFESLAVANGCQLITNSGADNRVSLDSPACRTTFRAYRELVGEHGPAGTQTLDTTRATYFAGRAPMLVWSAFLLDELSGERADARPSCPQCKADRSFLAKNTGLVTALKGPQGKTPVQYGEVTSWAVTKTAETGPASDFVSFMMDSGYRDWFGMAPEGKIPVREGTATEPSQFTDAWRGSRLGVEAEHRRRMNQIYPERLLSQLLDGVDHMRRWGIDQGEGALVGATAGELPVPRAVGDMTAGQTPPEEAAREAQEEVSALRDSLR